MPAVHEIATLTSKVQITVPKPVLEADIRNGRNLTCLSEDLAQTMLANANHPVNLDEGIDGEVAI